MKNTLAMWFTFGLSTSVMAHEGHGTPGTGHTAWHYLLEPVHIPTITLVVVLVLASAFVGTKIHVHRKKVVAKRIGTPS